MDRLSVPGISLKHALRHCLATVVFAGLAIVAAGCSDSRMAANNAVSNGGQVQQSSYQVGYGLSSEGPTTDLYHELKGSLQPPERPQVAGTAQPGISTGVNGQPGTSAGVNGEQVADSTPGAPQQPAAPPREQPTATMYGMSSDGPTTDVYTALFGRNH